jgi:hypothetical protein
MVVKFEVVVSFAGGGREAFRDLEMKRRGQLTCGNSAHIQRSRNLHDRLGIARKLVRDPGNIGKSTRETSSIRDQRVPSLSSEVKVGAKELRIATQYISNTSRRG